MPARRAIAKTFERASPLMGLELRSSRAIRTSGRYRRLVPARVRLEPLSDYPTSMPPDDPRGLSVQFRGGKPRRRDLDVRSRRLRTRLRRAGRPLRLRVRLPRSVLLF